MRARCCAQSTVSEHNGDKGDEGNKVEEEHDEGTEVDEEHDEGDEVDAEHDEGDEVGEEHDEVAVRQNRSQAPQTSSNWHSTVWLPFAKRSKWHTVT